MSRNAEYGELLHGRRDYGPNVHVMECWRICQRCKKRDREHMANWYRRYPRKWWQLMPRTELLCDECFEAEFN